MFDINLRPVKDTLFDPICSLIPHFISPLHITGAAFVCGIACCVAAMQVNRSWAVGLWILNRGLDCLDGAVARQRQTQSDLGGFLDLLGDFIVYSAIPICCTLGNNTLAPAEDLDQVQRRWLAVATAEATFYVNCFVLFFLAGVAEKVASEETQRSTSKTQSARSKELTTLSMKPALVEGFESGLAFTCMLAAPRWTEITCWLLSAGVMVGIVQRTKDVVYVLRKKA
jgi:phosphatidylglycerophosphate synthase